jgi:uncharacterized protein (PEP-CTERM system associated)
MRREPSRLSRVAGGVALLCLGLGWGSASADTWYVRNNARVDVLATNNVNLVGDANKKSDVVLTLTPQLQATGIGSNYRFQGDIGFDGVTYLGRSEGDHLYPRMRLALNSELIDRLAYLDVAADADTTAQSAFGALGDGTNTVNRTTFTRERISPYIRRELSSRSVFLARSDNSWTQTGNAVGTGQSRNARVRSDIVRYELLPQPFGLQAQWADADTHSSDTTLGNIGDATFSAERVSLLWGPSPEFYLGITGGRDHAKYGTTDTDNTLRGVLFRWQPTLRTNLGGSVEKRFFGTGWNARFSHRSPFVALSASTSRDAATYASQLSDVSLDSSVASLLDASLSTRITDPIERQQAVQEALRQRSLPSTQLGAATLATLRPRLVQLSDVSATFLGTRHTVVLRVFQSTTTDLLSAGETADVTTSANARQRGGSVTVSRRLTPETTLDLSLFHTRVQGFETTAGRRTVNKSYRLGMSHNLSARTTLAAGLRRRLIDSTVVVPAQETAVYIGALHRF